MTESSALSAPAGVFLSDLPGDEDYDAAVAAISEDHRSAVMVRHAESR